MKKTSLILVAAAALAASAAPALAHHNGNAEFDMSKQFTVTGTLVELKDINPHSKWLAVVKGPNGEAQNWEFSGVAATALRAKGVKVKEEIKPGDTYDFTYAPAWTGTKTGELVAITINGRKVQFVGE